MKLNETYIKKTHVRLLSKLLKYTVILRQLFLLESIVVVTTQALYKILNVKNSNNIFEQISNTVLHQNNKAKEML